MNRSELIQIIREDYLKNPIPLTSIQTSKDFEKVPFSSPLVVTEAEWIKKYPSIDSKRVYYSGAYCGTVFYYEPEEHVLINLAYYFLQEPEKAQSAFQHRRQDIIQAIKTGDYFYAVSHLEHATLLHIARDIILSLAPSHALYQFFMNIYIYADSGAGLFTEEVVHRLMDAKSIEQKIATEESLKDFPDEIVVYRGEGSASTPVNKAFSWTTSKKVAYHFATFYTGKKYQVITAKVKKADVVERFTERGEEELVLLPSTVYDKKTKHLFTTRELIGRKPEPLETAQEYIEKYRESPLLQNDVECHESSHSLRVTVLASYLADHEKVRCKEELLLAALFHDCGREDSGKNDIHGEKGYELYQAEYGENPIIGFLITNHCKSDEDAKTALPKNKDAKDIWNALCVLKDADALDRVRLPLDEKMDPDLLHFPYAEKLAGVASELLQIYRI